MDTGTDVAFRLQHIHGMKRASNIYHERTQQDKHDDIAEYSTLNEIGPMLSNNDRPSVTQENQSVCNVNNHVDISARFSSDYDNTGPITQCIRVRDVKITYEDIYFVAEKMKSSRAEMLEIEFCDCQLTVDHLKRLCDTTNNVRSKIKTLTISFMKGINELIKIICSIVKKFKISELSLFYDELKDHSIMLLQKHLKKFEVDSLEHLDVTYNKDISADGYKKLGEIMLSRNIASLKAIDCNITDQKFGRLFYELQGSEKIKKLNIGGNTKLTTEGFTTIGSSVPKIRLESLNLTGCNFSHETLGAFLQCLECGELQELDVSYNSATESDAALVPLVITSGVKKLSLAGCNLNKDHLSPLRELNSGHKMNILNMRDNKTIGPCMPEIAQLARKLKLEELNIFDCALSATELKSYRNSLDGYKLKCLHLGDRDRQPDADYMEEICRLQTSVEDRLYIQFFELDDAQRSVLKNPLVEIMLMVGSRRECIKSERTWTTTLNHQEV